MTAKMTIVGRIGEIRENRNGNSGTKIFRFSVASTPSRKDENGNWQSDDKNTLWVECVAFGKRAENLESSFNKGDAVFVEGKYGHNGGNTYQDADGNTKPSRPNLVVETAGHVSNIIPTTQHRDNNGGGNNNNNNNNNNNGGGNSRPQQRQAPAPAPAPSFEDSGTTFDEEPPF